MRHCEGSQSTQSALRLAGMWSMFQTSFFVPTPKTSTCDACHSLPWLFISIDLH